MTYLVPVLPETTSGAKECAEESGWLVSIRRAGFTAPLRLPRCSVLHAQLAAQEAAQRAAADKHAKIECGSPVEGDRSDSNHVRAVAAEI